MAPLSLPFVNTPTPSASLVSPIVIPAAMAGLDRLYSDSGVCAHTGDSLACAERVNAWCDAKRAEGFTVEFQVRSNGAPFFLAHRKPDFKTRYAVTYGGHCDVFGRISVWG